MKPDVKKSLDHLALGKVGWVLLGASAIIGATFAASRAVGPPKGIQPVTNFDLKRYLGKWYEIARIDHIFERGLIGASAEYSLNEDGSVMVKNRGYNPKKGDWKESIGKAQFLKDPSTASLKVSFFGPFYGGYNVVYIDDSYETALVIGSDLKYFWLLSKLPKITDEKYRELMDRAQALGIDLSKVVRVPQNQ